MELTNVCNGEVVTLHRSCCFGILMDKGEEVSSDVAEQLLVGTSLNATVVVGAGHAGRYLVQ